MCFILYTIDVGSPRDSQRPDNTGLESVKRARMDTKIAQLQPNSVLVDLIEWVTRRTLRPDMP